MWNCTTENANSVQNDSRAESLGSNGSGITTTCWTRAVFFYSGFLPGTMWGRITCWLLAGSAATAVEGVEATTCERFGADSRLASSHMNGEKFSGLPLLLCSSFMDRIPPPHTPLIASTHAYTTLPLGFKRSGSCQKCERHCDNYPARNSR